MSQTITVSFGTSALPSAKPNVPPTAAAPTAAAPTAAPPARPAERPKSLAALPVSEATFDFSSLGLAAVETPPSAPAPATVVAAARNDSLSPAAGSRNRVVEPALIVRSEDSIGVARKPVKTSGATRRAALLAGVAFVAAGTAAAVWLPHLRAATLPVQLAATAPDPAIHAVPAAFGDVARTDDRSGPALPDRTVTGDRATAVAMPIVETRSEQFSELVTGSTMPALEPALPSVPVAGPAYPEREGPGVEPAAPTMAPPVNASLSDQPGPEAEAPEPTIAAQDAASSLAQVASIPTPAAALSGAVDPPFTEEGAKPVAAAATPARVEVAMAPPEIYASRDAASVPAIVQTLPTAAPIARVMPVAEKPATPSPDAVSNEAETRVLRERAAVLLARKDVATARLFLKRAADMGDKEAADQLAALGRR